MKIETLDPINSGWLNSYYFEKLYSDDNLSHFHHNFKGNFPNDNNVLVITNGKTKLQDRLYKANRKVTTVFISSPENIEPSKNIIDYLFKGGDTEIQKFDLIIFPYSFLAYFDSKTTVALFLNNALNLLNIGGHIVIDIYSYDYLNKQIDSSPEHKYIFHDYTVDREDNGAEIIYEIKQKIEDGALFREINIFDKPFEYGKIIPDKKDSRIGRFAKIYLPGEKQEKHFVKVLLFKTEDIFGFLSEQPVRLIQFLGDYRESPHIGFKSPRSIFVFRKEEKPDLVSSIQQEIWGKQEFGLGIDFV